MGVPGASRPGSCRAGFQDGFLLNARSASGLEDREEGSGGVGARARSACGAGLRAGPARGGLGRSRSAHRLSRVRMVGRKTLQPRHGVNGPFPLLG